jgi:hypothetical protein
VPLLGVADPAFSRFHGAFAAGGVECEESGADFRQQECPEVMRPIAPDEPGGAKGGVADRDFPGPAEFREAGAETLRLKLERERPRRPRSRPSGGAPCRSRWFSSGI